MPITIGDNDPKLARCFDPAPEFEVAMYLLGRRAALRRPYTRDLFDRIDEYFSAKSSLLTDGPEKSLIGPAGRIYISG